MIQEVDAVLPYPLFLGMGYMEVADFFTINLVMSNK